MKKKDIFFVNILTITFFLCVLTITGNFLYKSLSQLGKRNQIFIEKSEDRSSNQEEKNTFVAETISKESIDANIEELVEENKEPQAIGYEYFEDALFIGDSRMVGIMEYGDIHNATFFADSGMSVFDLEKKKLSVSNEGKLKFDEVLTRKKYGKVYLMLGINELGYAFDSISKKYQEILQEIKQSQENAIIYLCANMHVTAEQSNKDKIYNNENVNKINAMISDLADNETTFYVDVNEIFDNEIGSLSTRYSSDSFHIYGKYYKDWVDWLCTKIINKNS